MVLYKHAISFSLISINGSKKKTDPSLLPYLLFGYTLSFCFTSPGNISFAGFLFTEDSTQHFVSSQCMLANLSSNRESPLHTVKETPGHFVLPNDNTRLFLFHICHHYHLFYLPTLQQGKQRGQTANRTLRSSHYSRSQSNLVDFCPAVVEHCPSGMFVCLTGAVILWLSGYTSNFTSGSWQFATNRHSWNNSRRCRKS